MRIVAGQCKGKTLFSPKNADTRPTSDRMREAIFSILGDIVYDATVLDLFAGTGALGLEALSRGARTCSFVENSKGAISLLKKNVAACKMTDMATVFAKDATGSLSYLQKESPFTLVFLDPPYQTYDISTIIQSLFAQSLLAPMATVVLETGLREEISVPDSFICQKERKYGNGKVFFLQYLV